MMHLPERLRWLAFVPPLLVAALASCSAPEPSAPPDAGVDPRVASFLADASWTVQADAVVGAAIAIVLDGKLVYAGGLGTRSIGGAPMDGDSLFVIGSVTKLITAAAVMSLVEENRLELDAPVTTYLPGLAAQVPFDASRITLGRLLSHTSGLEDSSGAHCALSRFSQYGASSPIVLWGEPGTFFDYSNLGYALAARAIEAVSGPGSYEKVVHDRVFARAGMRTATFDAAEATGTEDFTVGYLADESGAFTRPWPIGMTVTGCPALEPAGQAITSARDLGNLIVTLLAGGGAMLRPESVARMEAAVTPTGWAPNQNEGYGHALVIDDIGGETVVSHGGDLPPYHAMLVLVPGSRFGFAALVNSDSSRTVHALASAALTAFSPPPGPIVPPIKVPPSEWGAYAGTYVDPYGTLGELSFDVAPSSLAVRRGDAGIGSLQELNGDFWRFVPSDPKTPAHVGVFGRDDAGAVKRWITRVGVAERTGIADAGTE